MSGFYAKFPCETLEQCLERSAAYEAIGGTVDITEMMGLLSFFSEDLSAEFYECETFDVVDAQGLVRRTRKLPNRKAH